MPECKHQWKIFRDKKLIGTGQLSFYCIYCLKLKKINAEYT